MEMEALIENSNTRGLRNERRQGRGGRRDGGDGPDGDNNQGPPRGGGRGDGNNDNKSRREDRPPPESSSESSDSGDERQAEKTVAEIMEYDDGAQQTTTQNINVGCPSFVSETPSKRAHSHKPTAASTPEGIKQKAITDKKRAREAQKAKAVDARRGGVEDWRVRYADSAMEIVTPNEMVEQLVDQEMYADFALQHMVPEIPLYWPLWKLRYSKTKKVNTAVISGAVIIKDIKVLVEILENWSQVPGVHKHFLGWSLRSKKDESYF